jgi:hypothetical protein
MKCKEIKLLIADYQNNNLDSAIKTVVDEHLKGCVNCMEIHQEFKHLINTINQVQEELPGKDLELSFNNMLAKEKLALKASKIGLKQKNKVSKSLLQVAASILLIISSYLLGSYKNNTSQINQIATL